jgi:hypothetical protein
LKPKNKKRERNTEEGVQAEQRMRERERELALRGASERERGGREEGRERETLSGWFRR